MKKTNENKASKIAKDIVELVGNDKLDDIGKHLEDFMTNSPHADKLIDRLQDEERATALETAIKSRNRENDIANLIAHLAPLKVKRHKRIIRILTTGVAAAVLISASFFLFHDTPNVTSEMVAINKATTKPLLIMASGKKIIIETKNNKMSAADIVKINDSMVEVTKNRLVIPAQNMFTVILDDGTEVTLNAQSELEYPSKFRGDTREVSVKGEAYFNVAKSNIPFVVKMRDGEVKVYGTSFNIKDMGSSGIETVLISGSVGVKYHNSNEVMIKPNQRILINEHQYTIHDVDASQYTGWLNNAFQYYNTNAVRVIEDIEKWYGIDILNSEDKISSNEKISFNVDRSYNIKQIITLLEGALNITIISEGGDSYRIK